ncbi:MAG: hypothetical protein HXX19_11270 [Rhodoferax sp.]|nr:hypothetical protein [Rhodoferax sp.]
MRRPSFQFYPADWRNNANLGRCSLAARGAWLDVMCVLHDSDEYGIVRWPLKDLANSAKVPMAQLRELVEKEVLKGADKGGQAKAYIYTPRSGRKDGKPVTLVPDQEGPVWYSSRMVKDEYVRTIRGENTRFGDESGEASNHSPKPPFGDGSSSSSSSSTTLIPPTPKGVAFRFEEFWDAWPKSERKQDKVKCATKWKRDGLDRTADEILKDIAVKVGTDKWRGGFIEAPLVYLNGRRWEDGVEATGQAESTFV